MNRLQHSSDGLALGKDQMHRLLDALKEYGELIGPVHDGQWLRMQTFSKYEELCLKGISWFTSKEYFFPQRQVLFQFDGHSLTRQEEFPKRVLFGLRLCDLNAIAVNDKLFLEQEPQHREYKGYREGLTLVGLWCDEVQDKYCFCSSMELEHFYDICLYDRGDYYHIKAGSEKGQEILEKLQLLPNGPYEKEFPTGEMKLSTKDIAKFFDKNQVWQKGAKECLSCGDCTTLCPTCMCFDVQDEVEVDLTKDFAYKNGIPACTKILHSLPEDTCTETQDSTDSNTESITNSSIFHKNLNATCVQAAGAAYEAVRQK